MSRLTAETGKHDLVIYSGLEELRATFDLEEYLYVQIRRDPASGDLGVHVTSEWPGYD